MRGHQENKTDKVVVSVNSSICLADKASIDMARTSLVCYLAGHVSVERSPVGADAGSGFSWINVKASHRPKVLRLPHSQVKGAGGVRVARRVR